MKKLLTILLFFLYLFSKAQTAKEKEFKKTLNEIVSAYNKKDSAIFNKYIHKKNGIYFLVKNGVYDFWYNKEYVYFTDSIDTFKLPLPYNTIVNEQVLPSNYVLTYSKYPHFNCNSKSTKKGIFVDTVYKVTLLSNLIKKYIKFNDIGLDKEDLKNELKIIQKLESKSRKIVMISNKDLKWGKYFIFYLTYINQKWYISIIDFATFDCSV